MPDFSRCTFTEGSVTLPEGYSDRTVNLLLAPDDAYPSLNISRDTLQPGETVAGYITRQLDTLSASLKGWVLKARASVTLPEGYSDRTVNLLLAPDDAYPSLNISRDTLQPGETVAGYITRQLDTP
ncbi:DcrB-related protein, partial [Erwinia amylovora]|uniref:DcrB-related protein n=1 Tax=Erwinia amylovora TaxID=552 RepID=UPI003D03206E